jgi:hypothetical protein
LNNLLRESFKYEIVELLGEWRKLNTCKIGKLYLLIACVLNYLVSSHGFKRKMSKPVSQLSAE